MENREERLPLGYRTYYRLIPSSTAGKQFLYFQKFDDLTFKICTSANEINITDLQSQRNCLQIISKSIKSKIFEWNAKEKCGIQTKNDQKECQSVYVAIEVQNFTDSANQLFCSEKENKKCAFSQSVKYLLTIEGEDDYCNQAGYLAPTTIFLYLLSCFLSFIT